MKKIPGEIIEKGDITIKSDSKQQPYLIRMLDKNDLRAIMELQDNVLAKIEKREFCVPIPAKEMQLMFGDKGESVGLFCEDKLYAACSLLFDIDYENNMAREVDFSNEELSLVAQLELSLVDFDLRGHKLQQKLAEILAQRAEKRKQSRYLFTTVSPYNYASIRTVTSMGLYIAKLCKMYYDWDRYVVYKDFLKPIKLDTANPVSIPSTWLAEQKQLLNDGYRGFSQYQVKNDIMIMFAKIISG